MCRSTSARRRGPDGMKATSIRPRGERFGKVRRIGAGDHDLDIRQLVVQHMHCPRQPVPLVPGLEAYV